MRKPMPGFKLTSYEELMGYKSGDEQMDSNEAKDQEHIVNLPIHELHTFKNHPYKVLDDQKMIETVESVRKYGVLNPILVRTRNEGGYEIISGHRRRHAALKVGLTEIPAIIHECTDDEAAIAMVDLNIQREDISHTEKAKAYKIKYEALKHQGKKSEKSTLDEMAEVSGENVKKIQRYLCLSRLSEELLTLIDSKKLGFSQGVDISFLNEQEQRWVAEQIKNYDQSLTTFKSSKLKEYSKAGHLSEEMVQGIIFASVIETKPVLIKREVLEKLLGKQYYFEDVEKLIISLLEQWVEEQKSSRNS